MFLHGKTPEFPFLKDGTHVRSFEWNEDMRGSDNIEPGAWPLEELWAAYCHEPEGHLLIPHVGGRRSRIVQLDRLLTYIRSKGDVWFATMEEVANYVKQPRS